MPEFVNPHSYVVHLLSPEGRTIRVGPKQKVSLPEFYQKYVRGGFIRPVQAKSVDSPQPTPAKIQAKIRVSESRRQPATVPKLATPIPKPTRPDIAKQHKISVVPKPARKQVQKQHKAPVKQTVRQVGRTANLNPNELLRHNLERDHYPVSNNIGVGILSYNRLESLRRLVDSISRNTDLRRTTVFISDDCSTDPSTVAYLTDLAKNPNFVVLQNSERLGIAGNSNRLLRCLARFKYGLLLNDDVEILNRGWEYFYPEAMTKSGLHHLIYREQGVYGAELGTKLTKNHVPLLRVDDRPHGAVLAFDYEFLTAVGFFDESYGLYGMEHVDWSQRAWELGLQEQGFFDVSGSDLFFKLYAEASAVEGRGKLLSEARAHFAKRQIGSVPANPRSAVPEIAYVVPFRNFERTGAILTVMNNLRAQRFPVVHLTMVEQDQQSRIDLGDYQPITHYLVESPENPLFNKSRAFNFGVARAPCEMVVLHDADMLAPGHYTEAIARVLTEYEACHLGGTVIYTIKEAMDKIVASGIVDNAIKCDRVVGYYEGGSLACTKTGYWKSGGFNEDYWGYGCEDCDFYARISEASAWKEDRGFDFLHLWHSRVVGWNDHHDANRALEANLKILPIDERVAKQHRQLGRIGYAKELEKAISVVI